MDAATLSYYEANAGEQSRRYESADIAHLAHLLLRYLPHGGGRVLELGCGSGRDAAFLVQSGYDVTAIDASPEMIAEAVRLHPELSGRLSCCALPLSGESPLLRQTFDAIVAIALLMHIPDQELFEAAFQMRSMVAPGGTVILSVSSGREGLNDEERDPKGRLFRERPPEELQLLLERLGFRCAAHHQTPDSLSRRILWHTLVFNREEGAGVRSIDQIETIIRRDRKDATYKLALLKALCDIAQTASRGVRWHADGVVGVPLGLVAERWLLSYWPLVEPDLQSGEVVFPQKRGAEKRVPIAFRAALLGLIRHYKSLGGLSTFYYDFRSGGLEGTSAMLADAAFNSIARTIVVGPVTFAGGALEGDSAFFGFRGRMTARGKCVSPQALEHWLGEILVPAATWKEMCFIGYWVAESLILRWAELTSEMAEKRVQPSEVVERLLVRPDAVRDVSMARQAYKAQEGLVCVWTRRPLRSFDVDHVIPFSLWYNNDLWNLLPSSPQVNHLKSDRLISRDALLESKDLIIKYWRVLRDRNERRFDLELGRSLIRRGASQRDWDVVAFSGLQEAVETLALQRGVARWPA